MHVVAIINWVASSMSRLGICKRLSMPSNTRLLYLQYDNQSEAVYLGNLENWNATLSHLQCDIHVRITLVAEIRSCRLFPLVMVK